ncbi:MAG: T9SS type A sorting domain-containing protein [Bacteroidetes bacterium]|nr:T9SS type A sorting domain-containing protein [Bacteroidota bacterium]
MKTIFIFTTYILLAIISKAQPGTLDKSFGTDGKVITNFGDSTYPTINNAIIQADDKIVVIGSYASATEEHPTSFAAFRYTSDGNLDYNFGDSGKAVVVIPFESWSEARYGAIQKDGKILLSGYGWYYYFDPTYSGLITRLNTDGSIDSSFGTNGIIQITKNKSGGYGSIAVQADNKIVVIGGAGGSGFINRFLENGTLDRTFGDTGYAFISEHYSFESCKIQPDGKIVVGGNYYPVDFTTRKFCLQRYLTDGTLDKSFGDNGTVTTAYNDDADIHDLAFQSDGKIVVTGETTKFSGNFEPRFATARYNVDGSLDNSFGTNGKITTLFGDSFAIAESIAVMKGDKILIGGEKDGDTSSDGVLVRLSANGFPDSGFGYNGEASGFEYSSFIQSVLLQSTDKIVTVGGASVTEGSIDIALARYNNDLTQKQIIITKIRRWLQHHHGIMWDNNNGNISSYAVQRSSDGEHWSTIYHSPFTTNNHYNDPSPLNGANYYRLQTTSTDGAVAYSNIIAVANHEIKISPNPASNILHIEGLSSTNKTQLTIIDFAGNIKQQAVAGNNACNVNIASLHPRNYLLKIEMNGDVVIKKFVKE